MRFCLEGGTHQAFPGKRQPAACTGLRDSLPLRFVCGREKERESVSIHVQVNVSVTVFVCVCVCTLWLPGGEKLPSFLHSKVREIMAFLSSSKNDLSFHSSFSLSLLWEGVEMGRKGAQRH